MSAVRTFFADKQIAMIEEIVAEAVSGDTAPRDRAELVHLWEDLQGFIAATASRIAEGGPVGRVDGAREAFTQALTEVGTHVRAALAGQLDIADTARLEALSAALNGLRVQLEA